MFNNFCKYFILFIFLFIVISCNNKNTGIIKENYKHYTGTIAGNPITVDLFFYTNSNHINQYSNIAGSYYYNLKSEIINLSSKTINSNTVVLEESLRTYIPQENENLKQARWEITLNENSIQGSWKSSDGKKTYRIELKENYDNNSYPFDIISYKDSIVVQHKTRSSAMESSFSVISPSNKVNNDVSQFILKSILNGLGNAEIGAKDVNEFIKKSNQFNFNNYKKLMLESDDTDWGSETNNWNMTIYSTLIYNQNGMIVFEIRTYDYTGGFHGNYGSQFLCVDAKEKKIWTLSDILILDTSKLTKLLNEAANRSLKLKPGIPLSSVLFNDTVTLIDNVFTSGNGLYFHYNPYVIASYLQGEMEFYIPYSKIKDVLTPSFKERMKL